MGIREDAPSHLASHSSNERVKKKKKKKGRKGTKIKHQCSLTSDHEPASLLDEVLDKRLSIKLSYIAARRRSPAVRSDLGETVPLVVVRGEVPVVFTVARAALEAPELEHVPDARHVLLRRARRRPTGPLTARPLFGRALAPLAYGKNVRDGGAQTSRRGVGGVQGEKEGEESAQDNELGREAPVGEGEPGHRWVK